MFFHGALGQAHGLGNFGVLAAVDAVKQKNLAGAFGQAAQGGFHMAQIIARLQRCLGFAALVVGLFR